MAHTRVVYATLTVFNHPFHRPPSMRIGAIICIGDDGNVFGSTAGEILYLCIYWWPVVGKTFLDGMAVKDLYDCIEPFAVTRAFAFSWWNPDNIFITVNFQCIAKRLRPPAKADHF